VNSWLGCNRCNRCWETHSIQPAAQICPVYQGPSPSHHIWPWQTAFCGKTARNFPKTSSKHSTDLESELKAKRSVQAEVLARADWAPQHQHIPTNQL